MSNVLLQVKNLSFVSQSRRILDDVSFTVDRGQCFALLGPNGAGKTTTCSLIEGLLEPEGGEILVSDQEINKLRHKIGAQLQDAALYKRYTVRETINLFRSFYPSPLPTQRLLEQFDLTDLGPSLVGRLSGGQSKRLELACAMAGDPELLLLDEPTNGLDVDARNRLWEIIERVKKAGKAILLTTHYLSEAEQLADKLAFIKTGKIIGSGSLEEVGKIYLSNKILTLQCDPDVAETISSGISEVSALAQVSAGRYELEVDGAYDTLSKVIQFVQQNKLEVSGLSLMEPGLERLYTEINKSENP